MNKRILVIDESDISRDGYTTELTKAGAVVTGAVCHDQIDTLDHDALRVDLALVNLADPRPHWATDDFPGIGAVEDILRRAARPPFVVGYTTFATNPGLRLRARAAGVDLVYSRSELEDDHFEAPLGEMVINIQPTAPSNLAPLPSHEAERIALGITTTTNLEALVEDTRRLLLLEDRIGQRAKYSKRADFSKRHSLTAMTTNGAASEQRWPSWEQIGRIWQWLAKTTDIPPADERTQVPT